MDDFKQFSKALSAMAEAGAYSAKDIRRICTQEVQYEESVLWADNVPYAVIRTPAVQVPVYERPVMVPINIHEKEHKPKNRFDSWPFRLVAFLNEVVDMFVAALLEDFI